MHTLRERVANWRMGGEVEVEAENEEAQQGAPSNHSATEKGSWRNGRGGIKHRCLRDK
jgi:hypothetical protein